MVFRQDGIQETGEETSENEMTEPVEEQNDSKVAEDIHEPEVEILEEEETTETYESGQDTEKDVSGSTEGTAYLHSINRYVSFIM